MNALRLARLPLLTAALLSVGCQQNPAATAASGPLQLAGAGIAPAAPAPAPLPVETDLSTYRHVTGLGFQYPAAWQVEPTASGGLRLVPPDERRIDGQPGEAFTLLGQPTEGISSAADPRIAQFVIALVSRTFPHLHVGGDPLQYTIDERACFEIGFAGTYAGTDFEAAAQATVLAGTVLVALTLTTEDRFEARHEAMELVFETLHTASGEETEDENVSRDPALVGRWRHEHMYHSAGFSGTVVRILELAEDGSCVEHDGGAAAGLGGNVSMSGSAVGAAAGGRWRTAGNQLIIHWTDGSTTLVQYRHNGRSMLWSSAGATKLWQR